MARGLGPVDAARGLLSLSDGSGLAGFLASELEWLWLVLSSCRVQDAMRGDRERRAVSPCTGLSGEREPAAVLAAGWLAAGCLGPAAACTNEIHLFYFTHLSAHTGLAEQPHAGAGRPAGTWVRRAGASQAGRRVRAASPPLPRCCAAGGVGGLVQVFLPDPRLLPGDERRTSTAAACGRGLEASGGLPTVVTCGTRAAVHPPTPSPLHAPPPTDDCR